MVAALHVGVHVVVREVAALQVGVQGVLGVPAPHEGVQGVLGGGTVGRRGRRVRRASAAW